MAGPSWYLPLKWVQVRDDRSPDRPGGFRCYDLRGAMLEPDLEISDKRNETRRARIGAALLGKWIVGSRCFGGEEAVSGVLLIVIDLRGS